MSLDIFVMPLSRYLTGDFVTRAERFAQETGAPYHRAGSPKPNLTTPQAAEFVESLRQKLIAQLGPSIRWNDQGDTVFAEQFSFDRWHALRAFAANVSNPIPNFRFDAESRQHPALVTIWKDKRTRFPHLILHHDNQGYYLPTDFANPFTLPIYEDVADDMQPRVGSSLGLLRELNDLGRRLGLSRDQGQDGWTEQFVAGDPLELVKAGWGFMRQCARLSVSHKLPIIFDG